MAWLDWFTGKKSPARNNHGGHGSGAVSSALANLNRAPSSDKNAAAQQPAAALSAQRLEQRRTERNSKRELLFQVVRESMVRIGVLSTAFKFKVLSLDQRGRSFLVMIELSSEFSGEVDKLTEIESMIAQTAKHRYDLIVQAVYWRYFNAASTSATTAPAPLLGAQHAPISRPSPLSRPTPLYPMEGGAISGQAALAPGSGALLDASNRSEPLLATRTVPAQVTASKNNVHDELGDDEVEAFRRALAAGAAQGAMAAPVNQNTAKPSSSANATSPPSSLDAARSKLLLTGYEDTEMHHDDPMPALSGTQYGELR